MGLWRRNEFSNLWLLPLAPGLKAFPSCLTRAGDTDNPCFEQHSSPAQQQGHGAEQDWRRCQSWCGGPLMNRTSEVIMVINNWSSDDCEICPESRGIDLDVWVTPARERKYFLANVVACWSWCNLYISVRVWWKWRKLWPSVREIPLPLTQHLFLCPSLLTREIQH